MPYVKIDDFSKRKIWILFGALFLLFFKITDSSFIFSQWLFCKVHQY